MKFELKNTDNKARLGKLTFERGEVNNHTKHLNQ